MKKLLTALIAATFLLLGGPISASDGEPCNKNVKTIDKGDKIVICLNEMDSDGLNLKVYNPEGMIIESTTLNSPNENYEIDKPESGIYWVSMKNQSQQKFQRLIIR
ncbi:MAG: T9SS type A sorting domain-containing protein [Bacteroidia bacterium]